MQTEPTPHADGFRQFFYRSSDGLRLAARVYGELTTSGPLPAVCLPGLTRNARDFHPLALTLASERPVVCFDYRGRGRSDYDPNWRNYDVRIEAQDVTDGLVALGIPRALFIGTSRGGLIVMALAALHPTVIAGAVLNDIGPVLEGEGLAQIRAYLTRAPRPKSFAEAVAYQRQANGAGFPALSGEDIERTVRAFFRDEDGRLVPDMDPELVRTVSAIDLDRPLPVLWPQFMALTGVPLMAIRGEHSKLLSASTLEEMRARRPDMVAVTVSGQAHAPLLETAGLPRKISAFLNKVDPVRPR